MKKLLFALLVFGIGVQPLYGADQWDKAFSPGTTVISDLDLIVQNNNSLDRLEILARWKGRITPDPASPTSQLIGEPGAIAIPNAGETIVRWRRNTSNTTITWSNIDTGAEAASTQYYVYAVADADATTYTFKISTSSTAPSGTTYYRRLATFFNNSSSNIVRLSDYDISGFQVASWANIDGTGSISIRDSENVSSITDNATGDYTVTFANAMDNTTYAVFCNCHDNYNGDDEDPNYCAAYSETTAATKVKAHDHDNEAIDCDNLSVLVIGRI